MSPRGSEQRHSKILIGNFPEKCSLQTLPEELGENIINPDFIPFADAYVETL